MTELYLFSAAKMLHIASLIFWLGPTLGSWWVLIQLRKESSPITELKLAYKIFLQTLWVEHIAFALLLLSGAIMATLYQAWGMPWLTLKLAIVFAIIVPLEIVDIYIGNIYLPKYFSIEHPSGIERFYHGAFTKLAMVIIPTSVIAVFAIATTKLAFIN